MERSILEKYIRLRKVGLRLNHKILDRYLNGNIIRDAARDLGIEFKKHRGQEIIFFESEAETHFLMDYIVHDYILNGKRLFELYEEEVGPSNEIEVEILAAKKRSYVSLFKVYEKSFTSAQIYMVDLLNNRKVKIIDFGMGLSVSTGTIIGFRLIPHREFGMTSGTPIPFTGFRKRDIIRRFRRLVNKLKLPTESAKKYVALFRLGKMYGIIQTINFSDHAIRGDGYYTTM